MRIACILFPRLGVQLARAAHPAAPREVVLLAGDGDEALVSAASARASAAGISPGMLSAVARARCGRALFLADNAGDRIELLERIAMILQGRATNLVAIESSEHLLVDLAGMDGLFRDEQSAAVALLAFARTWSGLDVRVGVASSRAGALEAARSALHGPVVVPDDGAVAEPLAPWRGEQVTATAAIPAGSDARAVRSRLARLLTNLEAVLAGRDESFRLVSVALSGPGAPGTWTAVSRTPMHRASEALAVLSAKLPTEALESVRTLTVRLGRLGPATSIRPLAVAPAAPFAAVPRRPKQIPLLRAS